MDLALEFISECNINLIKVCERIWKVLSCSICVIRSVRKTAYLGNCTIALDFTLQLQQT